jgi:hypothetical protein
VEAAGGGIVFFPSGSYKCNGGIEITTTGVSLVGEGRGASSITFGSGVSTGIKGVPSGGSVNHFTLEKLKLTTSAASAVAIDFSRFSYSFFRDNIVQVTGSGSIGFFGAGDDAGASPYYNIVEGNYVAATGSGFQSGCVGYLCEAGGTSNRGPNAMTIKGGRASGFDKCVYIKAGNNINVTDVFGESIVDAAFVVGSEDSSDSGTATGGTKNTLVDTGASFVSHTGGGIRIVSGTGAGQDRKIVSNTSTSVIIEGNWQTVPDATSVYQLFNRWVFNVVIGDGCRAESGNTVVRKMPGAVKTSVGNVHISTISDIFEYGAYDMQDSIYLGTYGQLQKVTFHRENLAANLTNSKLNMVGSAFTESYLPKNVTVLGISVKLTINCSAGSATFTPDFNGIALTDAAVTIDPTLNNNIFIPFGYGGPQSGGARELGMRVDTDASFASTSTDVIVDVLYCTR